MQATATGTVTALYRTQSTVPEIHNLARMETITTPVSKTGLAQSLTYAVAKAGYGQTVTIRISKTENGTTYYQDYDIQLLRHLSQQQHRHRLLRRVLCQGQRRTL